MLHTWTAGLYFVSFVVVSLAQTPCQKAVCPSTTYCAERADGSTECIRCDDSCTSCNGPGPNLCNQCQIGYFKAQNQPCMPCADGFYGVNCTSICRCLDKEYCNKTNGSCMDWKCDRGYTGLPLCHDLCPAGTFGLDCQYHCHCPGNDNCSNINGDCSSESCHQDWGSAGCQRRLPKLILPPLLLESKCGNITLQWDAFNETRDIGTGPVGRYNVYMMLNHSDGAQPWLPAGNVSAEPVSLKYTYSVISGLVPDEEYNFRVDVVGMAYNKLMLQVSSGVKSDIITNPCIPITTQTPENTTKIAISRKVFDQVNVAALNSTAVSVSWVVLPEFRGYEYNVTLTQQLLGNGDCDSEGGPSQVMGPRPISSAPFVFGNLSSWSTYKISVYAVALKAELSETVTQNVTTLAATPTGSITTVKRESITSTEALLSWEPVPCNQRKGPLRFYTVRLTGVDSGDSSVDTPEARIRLDNLTTFTNYLVQIRYTNVAGAGPWSEQYNFTTLEGVPSPVEITDLTPTYSTITITFVPPAVSNGIIMSYTAMFTSNSSDFNVSQSTVVMATSGRRNMTVSRLSPETLYYLKMAASTSAGIGEYGSVKQTSTLKAPPAVDPMTLQLVSQTNSCLTVEWTVPANINVSISSFVLDVKRISADVNTPIIRQDISVSQSSYQMCQLKPSTLYSVTISVNNIDGVVTSSTNSFSTAHGTPPTPVAPVFVRSTYTTITIEIEPVVSLDVPITAYEIQAYLVTANRSKRFAGIPGYVTAELPPEAVTKRREFVVGDGQSYGRYINKALERESYYMIYYTAVSTLNGDTTASWSQLKAEVQTVLFDPALAPPLAITLADKNMTCLKVAWHLPQDSVNVTVGFTLSLKRTSDDSPFTVSEQSASTQSYQKCGLNPYTTYTVGLTARTAGGILTTASEAFTTVQNTPRMPAAPQFVRASFTSITVSIEPVILTDAPLTAYQLQVQVISSSRRKRIAGVPGYVTAQLTQDDVTKKINFTIGDGLKYGGYTNLPLKRETLYTIHYVVISSVDGVTKYNYSSLSPPVRTSLPIDSQDNTGVLIGVIVAFVIFIIIIILLILLYCWWKRRKNRFSHYQIHEDDKKAVALSDVKDEYNPENYWCTSYNVKNSRHIIAGRHLVYREDQYPHLNLETAPHPHLPKVSFEDEFHNLPHKIRRATENLAQRNRDLNRFPHLLPYDHSLVKLKPDANSRRTYINASFILGYKKGPAYIAAQSPYDDRTTVDFWRLIFQGSIKTVVMVTNVIEDGIVKCTRYWPESSKEVIGNFLLHLIEVREFADFIVRTVGIKNKGEEHSKIVKLFQFTSWPAHGVPDDPIPFLEMRYKVRRYHHDGPGPILVHCGTGMGRTGVFIAIDALIEQYASEGRVMLFDYVRRMRKDRPHMLRSKKQYTFIYEAVFEEFHAGDTIVDFDLKDRYHNWTQKNPQTNHTYLRDQQQLLNAFSRGPSADEFKTALLEVNLPKNRCQEILPPESHRPLLRSQGGLNPTDYINAVFLDSYFKKNHFIITQTPLHTTITDFWKLVYDYNVCTIVMLEDFKNEDNTCAEYWPSMNLKLFEPFFIETTATYQFENLTIRNFSIRSTQHPKKPARLVRQFHFDAWTQPNLTPPSRTMLLDLIDGIFAWQDETCQDENPVVVHCQNGASHSGLFAVLAILCEKMEDEEEVDVYRTIKHCKRRRTEFFTDYDQLKFCYKTLWDFINLRMPGGTFTDSMPQDKVDQLVGRVSLSVSSQGRSSDEDTM